MLCVVRRGVCDVMVVRRGVCDVMCGEERSVRCYVW